MTGTFRFLAGYARRNLVQYVLGFAALLATNYAVVRIPALLGDALNLLEGRSALLEGRGAAVLAQARGIAVELMFLAVVVIAVRTLSRVLFFNPGREIEYRLGIDLFERLLGLQRPYFNRHKVGELISVASNDTTSVRLLVGFVGLQAGIELLLHKTQGHAQVGAVERLAHGRKLLGDLVAVFTLFHHGSAHVGQQIV